MALIRTAVRPRKPEVTGSAPSHGIGIGIGPCKRRAEAKGALNPSWLYPRDQANAPVLGMQRPTKIIRWRLTPMLF